MFEHCIHESAYKWYYFIILGYFYPVCCSHILMDTNMLSLQRLSSKINYDVLEKLFDDSVSLLFFCGFQIWSGKHLVFSSLTIVPTDFLVFEFYSRHRISNSLLIGKVQKFSEESHPLNDLIVSTTPAFWYTNIALEQTFSFSNLLNRMLPNK